MSCTFFARVTGEKKKVRSLTENNSAGGTTLDGKNCSLRRIFSVERFELKLTIFFSSKRTQLTANIHGFL